MPANDAFGVAFDYDTGLSVYGNAFQWTTVATPVYSRQITLIGQSQKQNTLIGQSEKQHTLIGQSEEQITLIGNAGP